LFYIQELIPRLEAFEARFVPYHRQGIKAKRSKERGRSSEPKESRLNQKIILQALINLLKRKLQPSPIQSQLPGNVSAGDAMIRYDDLLNYLSAINADDGKPLIRQRNESPSLYRQAIMPTIKPLVHRLNNALRAAMGIELKGVGGVYYALSPCTTDAPLPKPSKVLEFAKIFCSALTEKCRGSHSIKMSAAGQSLRTNEKLRIRMKSSLSGWLSLVVIAPDDSEYLIPSTTSMKFHVEANKLYDLPFAADPLIDWNLQGQPGLHIVMAFVSPSHERLLMPPELHVRIRHDRGIGFQVRDVRQISPDEFAFSCLEFIVKSRRNDPRGGSRC